MFQYNAHSHPSKPGYQIKRTMNGCVGVFYPWKLDPVEHDTLKLKNVGYWRVYGVLQQLLTPPLLMPWLN